MKLDQTSFMDKTQNPIIQAVVVIIGVLVMMLIAKLIILAGSSVMGNRVFWIIAGTAILFFALFNSIISLSVADMNQYWTRSTLCYTGLMISSGFFAYVFSSMTISEAGTFRWIFMVLTFGYLLFLSVMRFMRKIVQIAQKEDDKWMGRMKR
jgi:hypothetical protein